MGQESLNHTALLEAYDRALETDSSGSSFTEQPWGTLLSARLPVAALASGAVASLAAAADRYCLNRGLSGRGVFARAWNLDPARITASFSGDRMMRIDGVAVQGFAELSGFFRSADGWVRTHANYPHHRRALTGALGLHPDTDAAGLIARTAQLTGSDIEQRCADNSAIGVRVRTEDEWRADQGHVTAPLVGRTTRGDRVETASRIVGSAGKPQAEKPLSGIRVLDLTRVIAGPVATRALALLGATVLRIDSPRLPEIEWQHLENGQGKRSALVDVATADGYASVERLLSTSDVLVTGYRPGSVDTRLPPLPPGIVHGRVSAWGPGSWADRRGFDSIVQAATGISLIEGNEEKPGALPAQALDHSSGYLLAAAVVDALATREPGTAGTEVSVSLARTAAWLLDAPGRVLGPLPSSLPTPSTTVVHGSIRTGRPALDRYFDYRAPARPWGKDEPSFTSD